MMFGNILISSMNSVRIVKNGIVVWVMCFMLLLVSCWIMVRLKLMGGDIWVILIMIIMKILNYSLL